MPKASSLEQRKLDWHAERYVGSHRQRGTLNFERMLNSRRNFRSEVE